MKLEIIYATTTGNAEFVAKKLYELSKEQGFDSNLGEMNNYSLKQFSDLENVAIITSTYGEGDLPEMGMDFWEELKQTKISLKKQKYGMIALGDRSHDDFCGGGKKISSKLEELGSKKIIDKFECDGDTEGSYKWSLNFLRALKDKEDSGLKMKPNNTCVPCNDDTKIISKKLKNRDPKDVNFEEAKKIFSPFSDKIKK